ncbi:MAG: hypothetical protein LBS11_01345 [Oscillospiraceae bacterium]|jgi:hypothetical protein|nr:hypothetical protein [Oscillospiraceae bacterium]
MAIVDVTFQDDFRRIANGDTVNLWNDIDIIEPFPPIKARNVTLNGRGHTLRGLIRPLFDYYGADTAVISPTVTNLNVCVEFNRNGITDGDNWGGLFRVADRATLRGVSVMARIRSAHDNIGGIAGSMLGSTLERCAVRGEVDGNFFVGGLVGFAEGTKMSQCHNEAEVTGHMQGTGGIVGYATLLCQIEECVNFRSAEVTGQLNTGGIVGILGGSGIVRCCRNRADVRGGYNTGGIAGSVTTMGGNTADVKQCVNSGDVSGETGVGGIAGVVSGETLIADNCGSGSVTGTNDWVGGIAGAVYPLARAVEIKGNRVRQGSVSGDEFVHRIVGFSSPGLVMTNNMAEPGVLVTGNNTADSQVYDKQAVRGSDPQLGGWLMHGMSCKKQCPNGACWDGESGPPVRECLRCP